jgi:NAD(P)-dependent dehydrogenase (short-subunit alcohol dehydrogenase family)
MRPAEQLRFDDRAVVVTGGGAGLGRQYALLLAARGASVVVADYGVSLQGEGTSSAPAESVAAEIAAAGGAAVACYASVSDPVGATSMVEAALDTFGRLDAVVNNAGIVDHAWMDALDEDQVRRLLDNHAIGTFLVTKAAWPHLVASGAGRVVNTVSESMLGTTPKAISYAAAKGAVFGLTRGMALDGQRHGVRVNAVAPRGTTRAHDPKVLASVFEQPEASFAEEFFSAMRPELVAPVVAYLAHDRCRLDGEVLVAGAGQVRRLVVGESAGIVVPELTPEDVAGQLAAILDVSVTEPMPVGYSAR